MRRHTLFKRLYIGFRRGEVGFERLYIGFCCNVLAYGAADRGDHGFSLGFLKPGLPE